MLDIVRKHAKSWLVKVLFVMIILVFVSWGGYSAYRTRHETEMAKVGETYISVGDYNTTYNNMVESYRKQLGPAFSDELVRKLNLKQQALESLINQALLLQGAEALGISASTDEVRKKIYEIPGVVIDGKFDKNRYQMLLRDNRMTPEMFEQQVAKEITLQKLESFIGNRALVTDDEVLADHHFNRDEIQLAWVPIDPKPMEEQVAMDDAAVRAFYETNKVRYMEPEKREIAWVAIKSEEVGKDIPVSDGEVKLYYDEHIDQYKHDKEVRARHILIPTKPVNTTDQDVEAARAEAQKVLDEIKKGKDFAELAKKYSKDPASVAQGGDLGWFDEKKMVPEFSKAAFALKKGEVSGLVKTSYGFHIIKVEDIREARTVPFDEVKGEIANKLKTQAAQDVVFKKARELRDLAYAYKDVQKAGQELKIGQSGTSWIDLKSDRPDPMFNPQTRAKLFELAQGDISNPIELPAMFVVAQVKSIQPQKPTPFEQANDKVAKDYRTEQAKILANKKASDILKAAVDKKSLAEAAKQFNFPVRQSKVFSRQEPDKDLTLLRPDGLNKVFGLDESKPFPDAPIELGNRFMICQLIGKTPAADPTPEEKSEISKRLLAQKESIAFVTWISELRKNTRIERYKDI